MYFTFVFFSGGYFYFFQKHFQIFSVSLYFAFVFFSGVFLLFGVLIMEEDWDWDPLARRVPSFGRGLRILLVDRDTTSLLYISSMMESHSFKGKSMTDDCIQ